jgi:RND superfamily putative drug exporter
VGGAAAAPTERFARLVVRLRYAVVVFWLAATVGAVTQLPSIDEAGAGAIGSLVPEESEALAAERLSKTLFAFPLLSRNVVVVAPEEGLTRDGVRRLARSAARATQGELDLPGLVAAAPLPGRLLASEQEATTALTYLFFRPRTDRDSELASARRYADQLERDLGGGVDVAVTGVVPAALARGDVVLEHLPLVEIATVALVLLTVGVHFRALGAPLLNLATVAIAYLIALHVLGWVGVTFGVAVPSEVRPVIVVLLFGLTTDYAIFFLSSFRDRLRTPGAGDARAAAARATADVVAIVLVAGLTIAAATTALLAADLDFFQVFGPGLALTVLIGLLVVTTFVPAVLAIVGARVLWPSRPQGRPEGGSGGWQARAAALATRRPVLTSAACVLVLLGCATGMLRLEVANPIVRSLPDDAAPARAYRAAAAALPADGVLSPTVAIVQGSALTTKRAGLDRLQELLAAQPGVAAVLGPGTAPDLPARDVVVTEDGRAARLLIVLEDDPLGADAVHALNRLQDRAPDLLARAGLGEAEILFAGDTAITAAIVGRAFDDLEVVGPLALLALYVVLALYLRALVAPLYLVLASVLGVVAAFGLTAYAAGPLLDAESFSYIVPFAVAILLVALGSDYNVFLVGRIWEQARRRPLRDAVRVASARAAAPITTAGFILAASFALLALVPLTTFQAIAFAMAAGLVLDVVLVRTLLVPALVALVGPVSGWPRRLAPDDRERT